MMFASLLLTLTGGVTLHLPEKVECRGVSLKVGDVVRVSGEDAELLEKINEVDLGYMPAPSFSRLIDEAYLQTTLEQAFPEETFTFKGNGKTRVYPKTQVISPEQVETAARAIIEPRFEGQDVELALRTALKGLEVPQGRETTEVRGRKGSNTFGTQSQGVAVDIIIDGELWRTQWTSWKVVTWQQVPVLTMPVEKGKTLTPAMFRIERRRQALTSGAAPLRPNEVIEAQAKRNLVPGEPVFPGDVERNLVIAKGNRVSIEVIAGGVTARSQAIALEDAYMGDAVRVRMETTNKEIVGSVVGRNRAEIRLR